jgi:riboflavin synthase
VFTGLIDDVGTIETVTATAAGRELRVACRYTDLVPGESVAVNGACLTVRECGPRWFTVAAIASTLGRTTVGTWQPGRRVNLERAMLADGRFGGHLVQGHVDGMATVVDPRQSGDTRYLKLALPEDVGAVTILHGSIAVDGVSLTVNLGPNDGWIEVALIEFTLRHTTLGDLVDGDVVHVEGDMMLGAHLAGGGAPEGLDRFLARTP